MNSRGQIVIPEEMRRSLNLSNKEALLLIEQDGKITIEKESDMARKIADEEAFWGRMSIESLRRAWDKEDEVWDKIAKEDLK